MPPRLLLLAAVVVLTGCSTRKLPPYEKPIARTQFQRVRTTAYTHTESDHIEHGCKTCIGTTLRYDKVHSAAADWSRWPLGTTFRILETGEICRVDDIGWALSGRNTIDLYKPSRGAMNSWGTRTVNIEILNWGDDREALAVLSKRNKYAHVRRMVDGLEKIVSSGSSTPTPSAAAPVAIAVAAPVHNTSVAPASADDAVDLRPFRQLDAFAKPEAGGGLRTNARSPR